MFAITTKIKVAAGIAAGVLTLGAAGAYAATNGNNTITVTSPKPTTLPNGPTLVSVDGKTLGTLPQFTNPGQCISHFAQNRDWALQSSGTAANGGLTFKPNFHGKLMSGLHSWCQTFNSSANGASAQSQTQDSSTDSADSGAQNAGALHAHGHGRP